MVAIPPTIIVIIKSGAPLSMLDIWRRRGAGCIDVGAKFLFKEKKCGLSPSVRVLTIVHTIPTS